MNIIFHLIENCFFIIRKHIFSSIYLGFPQNIKHPTSHNHGKLKLTARKIKNLYFFVIIIWKGANVEKYLTIIWPLGVSALDASGVPRWKKLQWHLVTKNRRLKYT